LQGAGGNPYALAVNAGGQINATGIQNRDGRIYLTVDVGQINVSGTLTATNNDGSGGGIHLDSGTGYGGEVLVDGTLDASSTSTGGSIHIDSSRVTLDNGAHLLVSGGSGNGGGVFVGDVQGTDYLYVAEDASIEANSLSGDAGNVDLSGAGVYFHGQLQARGAGTQATFNILSGEALEYTGLADLRAYGNDARFGTVSIETAYANLIIGANSSPSIVEADAIARQLNYGNVKMAATRADRYIDVLAPIAWQSATRLTLQADGNVDINQAIEASNGALYLISLNGGVTDVEPAIITVHDLWLSAASEVNLSNRVIAQNVTLYDVGGRTGLTNEQNQLGAVTFTRDLRAQSGEVDIVDSAGGLSLTTSNVGGITYATDGDVRVRTSGDLTLASAFQAQVDGDVTLVAAGGVLRNQSSAGATVFGTSSTGLARTRVYVAGVGEDGSLEGPAQYNVSYSANHEATASTGFYYSGDAPQGPGPSDPDPVDPVDPPNIPETPPLPPSQIIQTALNGNSFEQLNRPPQEDPTRFTPINLPIPQPPADLNSWTTGTTNQLETMAELAGIKGSKKQPENSGVEQQQQPPQQVVEQLQDAFIRVMALLREMEASGGPTTNEQLAQQLGSLPQDLNRLLTQAPAVVLQQLAVILAQFSMEQQNAALAARTQATSLQIARIGQATTQLYSQTAQLSQTAEQMRNTAAEQLVNAITQMVNAALIVASDPKSKSPTPPKALTPTPQLSLPTDLVKNVPPPSPLPGGAFTGPPPTMPKTIGPVLPPLPPAVQAQMDAFRNSLHQGL
jgi:hypothetical protein